MPLLWFSLFLTWGAPPAFAHEHKKHEATEQVQEQDKSYPQSSRSMQSGAAAMHAEMGEMMDDEERGRFSMSFPRRLLDWLGRLHPAIVHFPIAFFPAALFTALVGRRHPAFAAPVQFLVIAGGVVAPIAAVLGWIDAMTADPTPLLTVHRWLGTAIGISALGVGVWAWRRADQDRSWAMIGVLSVITAALVVQGWYGGAIVHGIKHLNW